jgi:hypothetical protein
LQWESGEIMNPDADSRLPFLAAPVDIDALLVFLL